MSSSPIRPEGGVEHTFIPKAYTARCGNDEHDYDASRFARCPGCGALDRLMIDKVLSDEMLHRRLMRAIRYARRAGVVAEKDEKKE